MIKIIADTTCVLPSSLCQKLDITIMPQIIIFGDRSYRDDTELDTATFLKKLRASTDLPKTAAPSPSLYLPVYQKILDDGDEALVICPSSDVSGTYRSATVAAQEFDSNRIHVADTRLMAGGLGSMVLMASQWAQEGLKSPEIVDRIESWRKREKMYFVVDTLEYLAKGGRIGGARALMGSLLQVKPILTMVEGTNAQVETQRTKRRALARLKELVIEQCPPSDSAHLCVVQSDAEETAHNLADELGTALGIEKVPVYQQCASIVVHIGPGVLSASFYRDTPQKG